MKWIIFTFAIILGVSASSIQFSHLPKNVEISGVRNLKSSKIADLNSNILGLSTTPVKGFSVDSDIFSRPRALAVIEVEGVDSVVDNAKSFTLENNGLNLVSLDSQLALVFGADREFAQTTKDGVSGSSIAQSAGEQSADDAIIKTKIAPLRAELEQVYKLAKAIKSQGAKFAESGSADVYRVSIKSLAGLTLSEEERETAMTDIQNAISELTSALTTAYGDQVVVEIIALSSAIKSTTVEPEEGHHIKKRDVSPTSEVDKNLKMYRQQYNVSVFISSDYPAIFAIFLGVTLALALAVLYATVGMMTMDPGKDSIIYRMTTTRMKKD